MHTLLRYCLFPDKHHRKKNNIDNIEEEMKKFTVNEPEEEEKPVKKQTKVSFDEVEIYHTFYSICAFNSVLFTLC